MNNAQLNLRVRIDRFDGFRESFQTIDTGDENILHAARLQLGDDLHPKLWTLVIRSPDAQDFFESDNKKIG